MKWDTLPKQFFSDDFLEHLSRAYHIESSMQEELEARLERSAQNWFYVQKSLGEMISPTAEKKALNDLSRNAYALEECLKNISDAHWASMVDTQEIIRHNRHDLGLGNAEPHYPEQGCVGEQTITVATGDSADPFHTIEISTVIAALGELALMADLTPQLNPQKRLTTQEIAPLQKWIANIQGLWVCLLGRKFTRDVTSNGEPISEAARFCVEVYQVLDPDTPKSRVLNEMKKRIIFSHDFEKEYPDWKR